jgi:hypothetical protein
MNVKIKFHANTKNGKEININFELETKNENKKK